MWFTNKGNEMSVTLDITWKDGRTEVLLLWTQQHAVALGRIGKEIGLQYFDGMFPIILEPDNVDAVAEEARRLLRESEARNVGMDDRLRNIIPYLDRLREEVCWKAMIG